MYFYRESFFNDIFSVVISPSGHSIVSAVVQSEVDEDTGNSSKLILESSLTAVKIKIPKKIPIAEHENPVDGGDSEVIVEKRKKKKRIVDENIALDDTGDEVKKSKKDVTVEEIVEKKSKKSKKAK